MSSGLLPPCMGCLYGIMNLSRLRITLESEQSQCIRLNNVSASRNKPLLFQGICGYHRCWFLGLVLWLLISSSSAIIPFRTSLIPFIFHLQVSVLQYICSRTISITSSSSRRARGLAERGATILTPDVPVIVSPSSPSSSFFTT